MQRKPSLQFIAHHNEHFDEMTGLLVGLNNGTKIKYKVYLHPISGLDGSGITSNFIGTSAYDRNITGSGSDQVFQLAAAQSEQAVPVVDTYSGISTITIMF